MGFSSCFQELNISIPGLNVKGGGGGGGGIRANGSEPFRNPEVENRSTKSPPPCFAQAKEKHHRWQTDGFINYIKAGIKCLLGRLWFGVAKNQLLLRPPDI